MFNLLCKNREAHKVSIEVSLEEEKERDIAVCMEASSLEVLLSQKTKWRGIGTPGPSQSAGSLNQVKVWCVLYMYYTCHIQDIKEGDHSIAHTSPTENIVYVPVLE